MLYVFVIAGVAMQFAIRAMRHGDVGAAIDAIVLLLILAFAALRWNRKRKH
jgi:hypothetical protein